METPSPQGQQAEAPRRDGEGITYQDVTVTKDEARLEVITTLEERVVYFDSNVLMALYDLQRQSLNDGKSEITRDQLLHQLLTHSRCQDDPVVNVLLSAGISTEGLEEAINLERRPFPNYQQRPLRLPYDPHVTKIFDRLATDPRNARDMKPGDIINALLWYQPEADDNL